MQPGSSCAGGPVVLPGTIDRRSPNGAAIAASTGFCNTGGCYTRYNDFQADYSANSGTWGYGSTVLGRETHSVDWSLTGAQNISKPVQYINSVTTKNVVFTGDLLYGTNGTPGTQISGKMGLYLAGAVAGGTPRYWDPNGYKSYDTSRTCHIVVHQFSWEYGSYSGYWYSYVKSIVHCQNGDGIYRFHAVTGLPSSPYGGGYNP